MSQEPLAQGAIVTHGQQHGPLLAALAKEAASILKALRAPAEAGPVAAPEADFVVLLVDESADPREVKLPDLKDRAGTALAIAADVGAGRAVVLAARKHLRAHGAALGSRELVLNPNEFGYLGLESDTTREKLEILLRALVNDAERLRLKREGWEEPDA